MNDVNPFQVISNKLDQVLESNQEVKDLLLQHQPPKAEPPTQAKTLTFKEACAYVDLSQSYMRFLCHKKEIPYYKPRGRRLYFKYTELDEWLLQKKSEVLGDAALEKALKLGK